jgi:hypothetical protein
MCRRDPLMVHAQGDGLCRLKEAPRPLGEFFQVHGDPRCPDRYGIVMISIKLGATLGSLG